MGSKDGGATDSQDAGDADSATSDETATESGGFIWQDLPDGYCGESCDIWSLGSCPPGQKCTSTGCGLHEEWDLHRCRPLWGEAQLGEPCDHLDSTVDGNDTCAEGLICWDQDVDTGLGTCLAFCQGTPEAPSCPADYACFVANGGGLPICLPSCEPLWQDCEDGDACYPVKAGLGFICGPNDSDGMAPYGTPCEQDQQCNAGWLCLDPARVPEPACEGEAGCCSPMCNADLPNACPGVGQVCERMYAPGEAPPDLEYTIGVCAVPSP